VPKIEYSYTGFENKNTWRIDMFRWAIIFAVIALIASLLGFGGVRGLYKDFAIILLVIAVILAIVGFLSRGKVYRLSSA